MKTKKKTNNIYCTELRHVLTNEEVKILEKKYLEYLHNFPCFVCYLGKDSNINSPNKRSIIAHHENLSYCFKGYKRSTDFSAITLCEYHHEIRHKLGREVYRDWFGDENKIFYLNFSLLESFFEQEKIYEVAEKIAELKEELTDDQLTNRLLFDSIVLWIGTYTNK